MRRLLGPLGVALAVILSVLFTALNGAERVVIDVGFTRFTRVPLVLVAFGGLVVGMLVMLIAGVDSDLRVRQILRERLQEEDREERERFVDHDQRDLFEEESKTHE